MPTTQTLNFRLFGSILLAALVGWTPRHAVSQENVQRDARTLPQDIDPVPAPGDRLSLWQSSADRWRGIRSGWSDAGFSAAGALTWDGSQNFRGGIDTQLGISRYLLGIGISADLEQWLGWRGATVFVDFQNHDGRLGDTIVGDFQVFSNIDAPRRTQVPRAWLQTHWLDDRLRLKAGKIDGNNEFAYTLSGGSFLNSSMGFSPTIFVMPTYPDPAGGLVAEFNPGEPLQLRVGIFDGVGATGVPTGSRLPTTLLDGFENLMTIAEIDRTWRQQGSGTLGRIGAGAWYHNGKFDRFDGRQQSGTGGWYVVADQWLYNEGPCECHDVQGIAVFAQIGGADDRVSQAAGHWGLGVTWTGAIRRRDGDVIGVGVSGVEFTEETGAALTAPREVATEIFYQMMLPRQWNVTTDLQAITDPGGIAVRRTALVGTLRVIREF